MNGLKLTYFNIRGRGEIIRMLLYAKNVPFDDFRVPLNYWFDEDKGKVGDRHIQLPIMTIHGVDYPHIQSVPLFHYFANHCDLYGDSNLDRLAIDQFICYYEDMISLDVPMFVTPVLGRKAVVERPFWELMYRKSRPINPEALEKNRKTMYPRMFTCMERQIVANTRKGREFCVGRKFSMADIALHVATQTALQEAPEVFHKFPGIRAMRAVTEEQKHLKEYLHSRPYTPL